MAKMTTLECERLDQLLFKFMHEVNCNYIDFEVDPSGRSLFKIKCGYITVSDTQDQMRLLALKTIETNSLSVALKELNPTKYKKGK